ncbi:hypothetical protein F5883DRAFT_522491 [Diaporthe sp. PMI_573]|nr:hypothetical protein F5883DRAFT_522491 [Diaporthaceae sp. PMI_573]
MEELPVLLKDLVVGKVVIQLKPTEAIQTARDADSKIPESSTKNTQFCTFSDGSHNRRGDDQGGVGLVYRRHWLPDGWTSEQTGTHPNGEFVKQAWSYTRTFGSIALEGVGVLEGLHAANKTITHNLQVLKAHDSTVTFRGITDCQSILHHIARRSPSSKKAKHTVPQPLIKRIKEEMQMLQSHGVKVIVELHWCPRNKVPQLGMADKLAGQAMRTGLGYCNVSQESWGRGIKSDMAREIESMVLGAPWSGQAPEAHEPRTERSKNTRPNSRTVKRRERWRARQAAEITTASTDESHPHAQSPLPELPLPSNPGKNTAAVINNTGSTTPPVAKPMAVSPPDTHLPEEPVTAEAVKRKVEDKGNSDEPIKKAKTLPANEEETTNTAGETGPAAQPGTRYTCTMPAACGMDPETKVFTWDILEGGAKARLNVQCPSARMVVLSTMEWRQERRMSLSMTI